MFRSSQKVNDNDFMSQHIFAEGRGKQQRRIGERIERERESMCFRFLVIHYVKGVNACLVY